MLNIVPIPKANDNRNPSNYRLICLLSVLSKLLEKHVHHIIAKHVSTRVHFVVVVHFFWLPSCMKQVPFETTRKSSKISKN